jgi:hypothetical protein
VLVVDDVLLAPFNGLMWVFRKIDRAAREELENRGERLKKDLSDLYMQLDTGRISEQEFDAREKQILDQLDSLKQAKAERASGQTAEAKPPSAGPPAPSVTSTPPAPPSARPAAPASANPEVPAPEVPREARPEPSAPMYKRWWFWGAAGAVLAGVVGAAAAWSHGGRKRPVTTLPTAGPSGSREATG